jgi:hypothetical protein
MNLETGLSNYVTQPIDLLILYISIPWPKHFLDQGATIVFVLHSFVLFVPFCG